MAAMTSPRKLPELVTDKCDPILKLLAEVDADGQGQVAAADKLERLFAGEEFAVRGHACASFRGIRPV